MDVDSDEIHPNVTNSQLLQIINADGVLAMDDTEESQSIVSFLNEYSNFLSKGFNYSSVAIVGPQSSGKSTLLNLVFDTSFAVLDSEQGRRQTTQGIWLGVCNSTKDDEDTIVVMDVEGTDGREKGEDLIFERKTSLFTLVLSSVLIVNMWFQDVGRYQAAGMSLIKTVFELNLQLFQQSKTNKKTGLLFIIRDHIKRVTPLEKLQATILSDLAKIWETCSKPEEFKNTNAEDYFDIMFTSLPHKELEAEDFVKETQELKSRFIDPSNPNYLLGEKYHKDIPADGFAAFANSIWEVVDSNKDLDLPTQKEMLAMFRCDEISEEMFEIFNENTKQYVDILNDSSSEPLENFGTIFSEYLNKALDEFTKKALYYDKEVTEKKKQNLSDKIEEYIQKLFEIQISKIILKSSIFFEKLLNKKIPKDSTTAVENFSEIIDSVKNQTLEFFLNFSNDSLLKEFNWDLTNSKNSLISSILQIVDKIKEKQLKLLEEEFDDIIQISLLTPVGKLLDLSEPDMWFKIRNIYQDCSENIVEKYKKRLEGFEIEEEIMEEFKNKMKNTVFDSLKQRVKDKSDLLLYKLNKKFEAKFNLDDKGLPRRWKPEDNISELYIVAREDAQILLELFSILRLYPEEDSLQYFKIEDSVFIEGDLPQEKNHIILTLDQCSDFYERFKKETEATYLQAIRDQENALSNGRIPNYMILMIIVLGWNEFFGF